MDIHEYISSGILESYALGDLSESERAAVEKNLALYPELREELTRIEEVQEELLLRLSIPPRANVRSALLKKISDAENNVVPFRTPFSSGLWKFAAAASIAVALVSSYLAYSYYSKWKNSETDLQELIAQNQRVAQDYNTVNRRLDEVESSLKVLNNPDFMRVVMKGTASAPDAMAYVYWNASTQEAFVSVQNLKALAKENQYQLWAIVDGKPVDAGVFDGTLAGLQKMKESTRASAFAVTIEPRGGSVSPTLETMQVLGTVGKV